MGGSWKFVSSAGSRQRYERLAEPVGGLAAAGGSADAPTALVRILADPEIEAHGADASTVYANVVCPGRRKAWYTSGGYPAASAGAWGRLPWRWQQERWPYAAGLRTRPTNKMAPV